MKQTIKAARMITIGLFAFCTMGLSNVTFAEVRTDNPVEVKKLGEIKNQLPIQLNLNNSDEGEYFINIKNKNYHILYSAVVQGDNISRIFKLDLDDNDLNTPYSILRIEITSEKTHKTQEYIISA